MQENDFSAAHWSSPCSAYNLTMAWRFGHPRMSPASGCNHLHKLTGRSSPSPFWGGERRGSVQASTSKKKFRPGELAPITGIYLVIHGTRHRERHEVVIIRGEQLPTCRTCKLNLTFEIVRPISHITHDWDFSGPHNLTVRPRQDD